MRLNGERLGDDELDVPRGRLAGAELRVGRRFAVIDRDLTGILPPWPSPGVG